MNGPEKALTGKLLAIAVDPSFLPKSGKKTSWIGCFWSGVAGEMKRGQEIFGVGVIDVENHDCMTLSAVQTSDAKSLEEMDYNLVEWYCKNLIIFKDKLQKISRLIVADAFFSKETFVNPMLKESFHVKSRVRNDAVLFRHFRNLPEREAIRSGTMERLTFPISISADVSKLTLTKDACLD